MQIKTTLKYYLVLLRMVTSKTAAMSPQKITRLSDGEIGTLVHH